jgi:hypothetical protein
MEAHRRVKFTDVELVTLVEKAAAGPCCGEAQRRTGGALEREEDGLLCSGAEEMPGGGVEA